MLSYMYNSVFDLTEIKNDFGIDGLDIVMKLWPVLHADGKTNLENELNRFKSYLVSQIKRGITKDEENKMMHCVLDYIMTDAGTNERLKAMENLFGLKFLENKNAKTEKIA